jgi:hypothetical protein
MPEIMSAEEYGFNLMEIAEEVKRLRAQIAEMSYDKDCSY